MDRGFLCTLVCCAFVLSLFHLPVPVGDGKFDKPIKIILEKTGLDKVLGKIGADILKKGNLIVGTITGKFDKTHKNVERGILWLKDHKREISGGLSLVEIAYEASTHVTTLTDDDYAVEFIPDDENDRYNIYVNDEDCGSLLYKHLENCSDEQRAKEFVKAKENAIEEYKKKHR